MASYLCGFPVSRLNDPHPTLRSLLLSWNNHNLLRRVLPVLLLLFSLSALPVAYAEDDLHIDHIDSPPQQCGSFMFKWSGGVPPYTFRINDAYNITQRTPATNGTNYTWSPVDLPSDGTHLFAEVEDSNQQTANSMVFKISSSNDSSCLGPSSSTSPTPSSTSSSDSASSTASTPITSTVADSSTPTASSPSSDASRTPSQRLSAGAIAGIAVGLAILIILAAGAFFYLWRRRRARADRGTAAGILGGAKYRAARISVGPSSASTEQPVTFWDANLFVREKAAATTQQG